MVQHGPRCRQCRRETMKLFLKGDKCFGAHCPVDKRKYPPGQHGQRPRKLGEYGLQLREKQKIKRIYRVCETQFRNYYEEAVRRSGVTGEILLTLLETRLDNMVYRMGFAESRNQARQLVSHRHFLVNGRPVNIASYGLRPGDVVEVREKSRNLPLIIEAVSGGRRRPEWVEVDAQGMRGQLKQIPTRTQIDTPVEEQLVVEFYSR
ncbi:MAG TPA: 30S ribosomal protein S4 [Armatimonadota bacterium]|jgi:small subunit ribosomal protein S4|nr:30S ribosomal protein S4 [Armatimonadota bacterium]